MSSDQKEIKLKMQQLGIALKDVQESFVCSSGPGGQNVNKVATAVVLKHLPTGIQVKCQQERSQNLNRLKAWRLLLDKIKAKQEHERLKAIKLVQKEKRKNRKRPAALKEKILEYKHHVAEKKQGRQKIRSHNNWD